MLNPNLLPVPRGLGHLSLDQVRNADNDHVHQHLCTVMLTMMDLTESYCWRVRHGVHSRIVPLVMACLI